MIKIEFNYKTKITIIQANLEDKFKNIINKYIQEYSLESKSIYFLVNGKQINPEQTIENYMNNFDKENNILKVFVEKKNTQNNKEIFLTKKNESKRIICPACNELCRIIISNYKIRLFGCINNHSINNIRIKDFSMFPKIKKQNNETEQNKFNNKNNHNNHFSQFLECKNILCLSCQKNHNSSQKIFSNNKNIFSSFIEEHKGHDNIFFERLFKDKMNEENLFLEIKKNIELFNNMIGKIIQKLNELIEIVNIYQEINDIVYDGYINKEPNYFIPQKLSEINANNEIFQTLKDINNTSNEKDVLLKIYDFYNNINPTCFNNNNNKKDNKRDNKKERSKERENKNKSDHNNNSLTKKTNQMTIIYNLKKNTEKIRLFGNKFFKNNKNNCYLLINGKKAELCEFYILNDEGKIDKNILIVKLIEKNILTNMSYMFFDCTSLKSLPDISKFDFKNVRNIFAMFYNCTSLKSFPDLTNLNKNIALKKNSMIVEYFLDIAKWNTKIFSDIDCNHFDCSKLKILTNISEWDMNYIYEKNTDDKNDKDDENSPSQSSQDENIWNTDKVIDMSYMFHGCKSLKKIPDFSNWNLKNVKNMTGIFGGCNKLRNKGDIYKWNINKNINKKSLFYESDEK